MEFRRKLVAYVSDEEIKLLEINNILSGGRLSRFSEWVRTKIQNEYGNKKLLDKELNILKSKSNELLSEKLKIESLIINNQQKISDIKVMLEKEKKDLIKIKSLNLNEDELKFLCNAKNSIKNNPNPYVIKVYYKNQFNKNFDKDIKLTKFEEILESI
jgi:hypothetical protein